MKRKDLPKNLPDSPGVYLFKKKRTKKPLYIGKATLLKRRIKSYFNPDLEKTRGGGIVSMVEQSSSIDFIKTDSVLEALLLEAELIKKYQPRFNIIQKDDKSFNYVVITKEEFPKVELIRGRELSHADAGQFKKIYGPFPHGGELREAIKIIRRIFPWRDKKCKPRSGMPCFNKQISLCPGVCTNETTKKEYNFIIRNISLFFEGKKKLVIQRLKKEMKQLACGHKFEEALVIRNKLFALRHIEDIALLKRGTRQNSRCRIEAYDIAHTGGSWSVGVMTVNENGHTAKNEYRKFRIRSGRGADDTGNLKEVLLRRFRHYEWSMPDMVVVDGGTAQVNAAKNILKQLRLEIPVIGVVKGSDHKVARLIGAKTIIAGNRDEIILTNAEAHRFAIGYHKKVRSGSYRH